MLPILMMNGVVKQVYISDRKRDREGKEYGGDWVVQLEGHDLLQSGYKLENHDLKTKHYQYFESMVGRQVSVPVQGMVISTSKKPMYRIHDNWNPPTPPAATVSSSPYMGRFTADQMQDEPA